MIFKRLPFNLQQTYKNIFKYVVHNVLMKKQLTINQFELK